MGQTASGIIAERSKYREYLHNLVNLELPGEALEDVGEKLCEYFENVFIRQEVRVTSIDFRGGPYYRLTAYMSDGSKRKLWWSMSKNHYRGGWNKEQR